ncbi:MAG: DUF4012 domain-containing protein [Minisyncoccia bacterium]
MRIIKIVLLLIFCLLILGGIFYLGDYLTNLKYSNQKVIEIFKNERLGDEFNSRLEALSKLKEAKENFFKTKQKLEQFIYLIPKIKDDVVLKENLNEIIDNLDCFLEFKFISDGLNQKENSLDCLKNLAIKLETIKNLDILPINQYQQNINSLVEFLGDKEKKNYLVLIQYPLIPRPSGGFLAAYGILSFDKGKISFVGDHIIDLDNFFTKKIIPPEPLEIIANQWFFHDLNWFYDFNLTGKKILENAQGILSLKLDGVIIINPEVVAQILEPIGEVKIENYPLVITANNFNYFLKEQLEAGMKPGPLREKPLVLDKFFSALFEKLKGINSEELINLSEQFSNFLSQKDIQLYFRDENLNQSQIFQSNSDKEKASDNFIGVNFSYLEKEFQEDSRPKRVILKTEISNENQFINQITVNAEAKNPQERKMLSYLKIYLPEDIEVLEARGLVQLDKEDLSAYYQKLNYIKDEDLTLAEENQIKFNDTGLTLYKENGKLVAGGFAYLGQSPFVLKYALPKVLKTAGEQFSVKILKQSGQNINFLYKFVLPDNLKLGSTLFPFGKWIPLDKDLNIKVTIEKNEPSF